MAINWNRRSYTKEQFLESFSEAIGYRDLARRLGLNPDSGGIYNYLKIAIEELGLDDSHFKGQGWSRDTRQPGGFKKRPDEEVFVENSDYLNTHSLKQRMLKDGLAEPKCSGCGRTEWDNPFTGETVTIPLALDHVNGNRRDNRLQNLRLLCYNCHGLTDTFCSKNTWARRQNMAKSEGLGPSSKDKNLDGSSNLPVPTLDTE